MNRPMNRPPNHRLNRRRFLTLTAAAFASPANAVVNEWQGTGLGAALELRLIAGTSAQARKTFGRVEAEIARIEATASLYRDSALVRLNRDGHLAHPSPGLLHLLGLSDQIHRATDGIFDPTVQPLWRAIATGGDIASARALIGWDRVTIRQEELRLAPGQALTLNGIAQGWAADRIAAIVREAGYGDALIDMGEVQALGQSAGGRSWQARIADVEGRPIRTIGLSNRALATSAPFGSRIGTQEAAHILGPQGQPAQWQTISVSADSAALADALSTAFCLMPMPAIERVLRVFPDARLEAAL